MRLWLSLALFCLQAASLQAALTPEELRGMAYAGDIDGAEQALSQAHAESLDGTISFAELRQLATILNVSHPDVIEFVEDWLVKYPTSPYANSLRAFQMRETAWRLRGTRFVSDTHPDALHAFSDLQNRGMNLALEAYAAAPDYVLASDAVFTHQLTTKRLDWDTVGVVVDDVMTATPSRDSLMRISLLTLPQWGGVGHQGIVALCDQYSEQLTDVEEGYSPDVCTIDLIHSTTPSNRAKSYAARLLGDNIHPNLLRARLRRAAERKSDEDQELILSFLSHVGVSDYEFAEHLARHIRHNDRVEEQMHALDARWQAEASIAIAHDPYNSDLIDILLRKYSLPMSFSYSPNNERAEILIRRHATAVLFDGAAWARAASTLNGELTAMDPALADPFFVNAIYYSDYYPDQIAAMIDFKSRTFAEHQLMVDHNLSLNMTDDEVVSELLCPIVRLERLFRKVCDRPSPPDGACSNLSLWAQFYPVAIERVRTEGLCQSERTAPISELMYQPMRPDMKALHEGIANR